MTALVIDLRGRLWCSTTSDTGRLVSRCDVMAAACSPITTSHDLVIIELTHKNSSGQEPLLQLSLSTILTIVFLTAAIAFAVLGFSKAGDLRIAPELVTVFLFISGAFFAAQFVNGIRSKTQWQRVTAVISVFLGVFVVVMGIMFYQVLTQVQTPKF